ncbi:exocyst complex component EXO70B1-like [Argentina anserina]|uniref:exocyst complex component EXO70B1-like n=1 Tax=Argentina anserina TaxID=57926 RepID=UPI00217694CE|nr:exocyst complex component EXO70B1-like [Potentilla anserina]
MEKDEATNTPKTSGSTPKSLETPKAAAPESPAKNSNDQKEDSDNVNADLVEKDKDTADGDDSCPLEPVEIPDPHPTLEKLYEDIERCISSLPRPTEKDATDGSQQEANMDNASNEAKDTESEDVKDDKVEKEEEKGETDAKEEEEEKRDVKDENKEEDEKELGDKNVKDEKEAEKVDDGIVEKEKDPVPEELLLLINKFLTWIDDICCEGRSRWGKVPDDDDSFLDAVDQMAKMRESLLSLCSMGLKFEERHGGLINHLSGIQHRAMAYLEEEFRVLLEEYKTEPDHCTLGGADHNQNSNKDNAAGNKGKSDQDPSPESESTENLSGVVEFPGYSPEAVSNLNKIAKKMISTGYEYECCEVYIISRRHAFDDNLHKIGLQKHSIDDIQRMQWEALEREIGSWVKALKQCTAFYFSGERKLAESVFSEHPLVSSYLFSNLSRGVMIQLLNFAEGIGMAKRAAEKLFKTLDMYEAVKEVIPKMEELFPEACVKDVKTETTTVLARLGEAAICIFCDLENSIKAETGRNPVPGGAVHPLTRYTMNYLRYACEYKDTLELVFKEHAKIERTDSTSRPGSRDDYDAAETSLVISNDESPFSVQLARVMALLDSNLEAKSKLYKDVALSSIFMMNNGRYILQKIRGSPEINACMGDTWCRKRSSELRQYHKNYQRETWSRLLSFLSHEGLSNHGKVQKPVLKERFKSFNAMFDEIHRMQSTWVVSDEQLQSELRVSISAVVIPAYRSFLGRFAQVLDPGRQTEKYIKFQPEDIETYIDELFDGNPNSSIFNRKRP